jgi:proline iminopeptidase
MRGPHTYRTRRPWATVIQLLPRHVGVSIADMPSFHAADGTELAYHVRGAGTPLVCLPGGLSAHRKLIMLDMRGTGMSAFPADPASYRCDRLVEDVDALREHLGLDRFDLVGHSAGANVAAQYAAKHQGRVGKLALITPDGRAVGLAVDDEARREILNLRRDEPWFAEAAAAFDRGGETADDWRAIALFFCGRWDSAAHAHWSAGETQESEVAACDFGADGAFDPVGTRGTCPQP